MMRRIGATLVALALLVPLTPTAFAALPELIAVLQIDSPWCVVGEKVQLLDENNPFVTPIAEENRTLVPVGQIVKAYGGTTVWSLAQNRATFTLGECTVAVELGTTSAWVDGAAEKLEVPARAMHDRTYVPLRFVLEHLGLTVAYDAERKIIAVGVAPLGALEKLPQLAQLEAHLAQQAVSDEASAAAYYYALARNEQLYQQQFYEGYSMMGEGLLDPLKPDGAQIFDAKTGETWAECFTRLGEQSSKRVEALCADAKRMGYTLSDRGNAQVEQTIENLREYATGFPNFGDDSDYLAAAYGPQITAAVFRREVAKGCLAEEYSEHHGAALIYTEAEVTAYAKEHPSDTGDGHTVAARFITFFFTTATATEDAKQAAQDVLNEWKAGEKTELSFAQLADRYSKDKTVSGGLYAHIAQGDMVPEVDAWCFDPARKPGDVVLLAGPNMGANGWHVAYFVGKNGPLWRERAETALRERDQARWLEQLINAET